MPMPAAASCGGISSQARSGTLVKLMMAGLVLIGLNGCGKAPPRLFNPPPIAARVPAEVPEFLLPEPPELEVSLPQPPQPIVVIAVLSPANVPPPPEPPPPPDPVPPPEPVVVETPPPPDAPKLAQIFTPQERLAYNRQLDEHLDNVRKAVASLAGRRLNVSQQETLNSIRTFQRQAEEARGADLVTAVRLASRADLLAADLLQRLR